ncbi:hypothetical protein BDQ17DRAFT_1359572 [Cyathus striatus]|nr:hypothetical protein BDQ17DRAFT_1359572 [Cyathus striatus]
MPPPPPPPICFPFTSKKGRRLSWSNSEMSRASYAPEGAVRQPSHWSGSSVASKAPSLAFTLDSERYDEVPSIIPQVQKSPDGKPKLVRGNTMTGTKKSTASSKWGYGWGIGKKDKMKEAELEREKSLPSQPESMTNLPLYQPPIRRDSKTVRSNDTKVSHRSQQSQQTYRSNSSRSTAPKPRPPLLPQDSSSTLVGSAFERKITDNDPPFEKRDTTQPLEDLRKLMVKENLDFYVVPSEDAHGSEYVAHSDKRRSLSPGDFAGTAGQAIITKTNAYLITDARYWAQAREQTDHNWEIVQAGARGQPRDWIEWLEDRVQTSRIGIDARMVAHEKAALLNSRINSKDSKLVFPPQNLVDLAWKDKPPKSLEPLYVHGIEYTGRDATYKIAKIRDWIKQYPPAVSSFHKGPPKPTDLHVGTLITSLPCVAYVLNLRGSDVPYNPLFHAYLFIGLESTIVFVDSSKVTRDVPDYLEKMNVQRRDYTELWTFLRKREWGEGKVSFYRHIGFSRAYIRDGVAYVRWLAWLESKLAEGYDITEYEAEFHGPRYEPTSATGPNGALPHYTPKKGTARLIERDTPYVNDSGGQYFDGTCDTTRTLHFGRPSPEQCDAYTRVLQGHIAIDSAIFPEGTSGHQLDVLARKALWKDGMNYAHGTGHGFGSFLTVHEGPHGFSSNIPLDPGHVITNEPVSVNIEGKWGMRIESALAVRRVKTRGEIGGDVWLGFERLTCVPIQTKMVKESMLTKEEKQWLKEHNQRCLEKLTPYIKDDKRAMKWLKREADRGIGIVAGPGGMSIDWD